MCSTRPRVWQAQAGRKSGWRPAQDASGRRARSGQRSGSGVQRGEQPELPAGRHAPVSFTDASCALPLFLRKGAGRGVRPAQCSEKLSVISSATIGAASARGHLRHATCDLLRRTPDLSASGPAARWQRVPALALVGSATAGAVLAPHETCAVLLGFISIVFLCLVVLRALGLVRLLGHARRAAAPPPPAIGHELPVYLDPRPALSRGGGRA